MLSRTVVLRVANWAPMKEFITHSRVSRRVVNRFVAGDTIEDATTAARGLNKAGFCISLDFLGENSTTQEEALTATQTYCSMLDTINTNHVNSDISIKLTQIGIDFGDSFCKENLIRILETAASYNNAVEVDMESSKYTHRTLKLFADVYQTNKNMGTVIQSYLHRSEEDVDKLISLGAKVRLVKGAYLESPEIAYQKMTKVNEQFDKLTEKLLLSDTHPAIATHDPNRIAFARKVVEKNQIPKEKLEFQMLYGIRRDLQKEVLADGYTTRIYLPYGTAWYPYFSRRLAERPSNLLFIIKNFFKK